MIYFLYFGYTLVLVSAIHVNLVAIVVASEYHIIEKKGLATLLFNLMQVAKNLPCHLI